MANRDRAIKDKKFRRFLDEENIVPGFFFGLASDSEFRRMRKKFRDRM